MRHRTHYLLLTAFSALAIGLAPAWTPLASADEADGAAGDVATEQPAVDAPSPDAGDVSDPVEPVVPVAEDPAAEPAVPPAEDPPTTDNTTEPSPDSPAPPVDIPALAPDAPVTAADEGGGHDEGGGGHGEGGTLPAGVVVTVDGRDISAGDPAGSLPKIASCTFAITATGLTSEPADMVGVRIIAWPPSAPEESKVVLVDVTESSVDGSWSGSFPLDEAVQDLKRVGNGYHMRLEFFINGEKGAMKMYWLGCGEPQTGNPRRMLFDVQWVTADGVVVETALDDVLPDGWRDDFALTASGERGTVDCSYPPGSDDLECVYVNPGHGDEPGLVLPGKPGTGYTVEVAGVPDGWTVDTATIGAFLADDTCPKAGGHDDGHGEDAARMSEEEGEERRWLRALCPHRGDPRPRR